MMKKITDWVINNSLLGAFINTFLGDNWREERPKTAAVVYTFFVVIYFTSLAYFFFAVLSD